jgi:hypothetical protein
MKRTIFTVIVAVFAAAFFMVGNSFAEDQEQNAQENINSTADCTAQGTGIISGTITRSCDGSLVKEGVWVDTSSGISTYIENGVYVLLCPAGQGSLYFKSTHGTEVAAYSLCAGTNIEINKVVTWDCKTTTTSIKSTCN